MLGKNYLNQRFYDNSYAVVYALNLILEENHMTTKEFYENGGILQLEAERNKETLEILGEIISDINRYELESSKYFNSPIKENNIDLTHLVILHEITHGLQDEIHWDKEYQDFNFKGAIEYGN